MRHRLWSGLVARQEYGTGALAACSGDVERAADWIFSHMDDLEQAYYLYFTLYAYTLSMDM